jgi:hypothetical protein
MADILNACHMGYWARGLGFPREPAGCSATDYRRKLVTLLRLNRGVIFFFEKEGGSGSMENLTAKLSRTDHAIVISVAGMVGMPPDEFLALAGKTLVDALTGLYTVMSKSVDLRTQVADICQMRMAGSISEQEMAAMLDEIGGMAGDEDATTWTPGADL